MTFELNLQRLLPAELARLLEGGIDSALTGLDGMPDEDAIHAVRRHIKKARAVLRLLDSGLKDRALASCDGHLRAAGRVLSAARDAAVLLCTIDKLAEPREAKATTQALQRLRDALQTEGAQSPNADALLGARQALHAAHEVVTEYDFADCSFAMLAAGFATTYRTGRRALRRAQAALTANRLHTLRKALKHHGYQLRLLESLWPEPIGAFQAQADRAAGLLGQHHDYAVLREYLAGSALGAANQARVDALATRRQLELAAAALVICRRLYAERSRCYARRLEAYCAIGTDAGNTN